MSQEDMILSFDVFLTFTERHETLSSTTFITKTYYTFSFLPHLKQKIIQDKCHGILNKQEVLYAVFLLTNDFDLFKLLTYVS